MQIFRGKWTSRDVRRVPVATTAREARSWTEGNHPRRERLFSRGTPIFPNAAYQWDWKPAFNGTQNYIHCPPSGRIAIKLDYSAVLLCDVAATNFGHMVNIREDKLGSLAGFWLSTIARWDVLINDSHWSQVYGLEFQNGSFHSKLNGTVDARKTRLTLTWKFNPLNKEWHPLCQLGLCGKNGL